VTGRFSTAFSATLGELAIMQSGRFVGAWIGPFAALAIGLLAAPSSSSAVDLIAYVPDYRMTNNPSHVANVLPLQIPLLDEVRYFGITVNANGSLTTTATHLSQIQTLKQMIDALPASDRPRLNLTFGGYNQSTNFATVAASATLRATFAQNIEQLLDQTGATSVDLDWEHPSNATQRANYALMLQRIKQEVGATRSVYATMAPEIFLPNTAFQGANAIDGVSLMTYDLGWWGNDPQNPNTGEHSLHEYVEDSVDAWTDPFGSPIPPDRDWVFATWGNNTAADKLGVGLPLYGRNISNGAEVEYQLLVSGGTTSDGNYYTYPGHAQPVWAVDPELAEQRVQFAHDQGLKNIIIWELFQDLHPNDPNSLLRASYEANQALLPVPGDYDGDRDVDADDFVAWMSSFGSQSDLDADGNENLVVDAADYVIWRQNATSGGGAISTVPEPNSASLLCILALLFSIPSPRVFRN
jgi:hypothetical protein